VSISTPLKKLISWPAKAATALAKSSKKAYRGLGKIRPAIKEDIGEKALDTKEKVLRARKKTIAVFRRPMNDVSHIGIAIVICIALLSGISAMFGTTKEVSVNPFVSEETSAKQYLSNAEKRIVQADSVTTVAYYIDQAKLGPDAAAVTEQLNTQVSSNYGGTEYIASVPIVQNTSSSSSLNKITDYIVQNGDTLSTIASKFNVSTDTIRYANAVSDIDSIAPGDKLLIPPVTGVLHTVASGETTAGIAKRYNANEALIVSQNDLYGEEITVGMKLMVPDGEIPEAPKPVVQAAPVATKSTGGGSQGSSQRIAASGQFMFPTVNAQGYYNGYHNWAIDVPGSTGTPIFASDSGRIVEAQYGYNGGYGNTILIDHGNGFTTRYAHMSSLAVIGGYVSRGQVIGYMGSTGRSTGSHLHFEILIGGSRQNPINYF
jgi:murein DD-endopeptidase MepM/ murein hydrolase activator NlpD